MKNKILKLSLAIISVFFFNAIHALDRSCAYTPPNQETSVSQELLLKTPVHATLTSSSGCTFAIDGEYNIWTHHFSGTVKIKCPNEPLKTYTFSFVVNANGTLTFVEGDEEAWNFYISADTQLQSDISTYLNSQG